MMDLTQNQPTMAVKTPAFGISKIRCVPGEEEGERGGGFSPVDQILLLSVGEKGSGSCHQVLISLLLPPASASALIAGKC